MPRFVTLLLLFLISTVVSVHAQKALLPVKFTTFRHPAPGYFLFAPNSPDSIALTDHSGKTLFPVSASNAATFQFADSTVTHFIANKRVFVRRNARMEVTDTLRLRGAYPVDFHDGHMLKNGNYVVLGIDIRTVDMSALVAGGNSAAKISGAIFQERTLGGETVFEWKSLDHIPVTDATEDVDLLQAAIDYIHVNAVAEDSDGNYLVSCRHLDEIIKINRATGAIIWRFGGSKSKGNQFTFLNDNGGGFVGFSHQHDVFRTAAGRIMMLDNGNLKPTPFSRAVEYEIDETLKTARLTWSFQPDPAIYTQGMGSVQELENGNIVIGWGNAPTPILAHEVSRDGIIQAEIRMEGIRLPSYRVKKAVFAMSGVERVATTPGTYAFTHGDSNTRITMALTRVDAATSIIAERHSVPPRSLEFTTAAPCVPLPMRWVIRVKDTSKVSGSTKFAVGSLSMVILPSHVKLYHRPTEGTGKFSEVSTTLDSTAQSLVASFVRAGEYALAFRACYNPVPVTPAANAADVSLSPTLAWSEGLQTGGYDVEVYVASVPAPFLAFRTFRLDTVITGLEAGEIFTWRVRARRNALGPWSALSTFRTRLSTPLGVAPNSLPDSVSVALRPLFSWSAVSHATTYRLQVFAAGSASLLIDTVVPSLSFQPSAPLGYHTWYRWQVRAELDTLGGPWSTQLVFVTPPSAPSLVSPTHEALDVDHETAEVTWKAALGAVSYHVRVLKEMAGSVILQDTVVGLRWLLTTLNPVTRYYWQVRSISRYGNSEWSSLRWFLTSGASSLTNSTLISPNSVQNVDTVNTTLMWSPVDGATYYTVELTTKPTFSNPELVWLDVRQVTQVVQKLQSGRLYRWRVMALSDVASGMWSSTGQFTTMPGPNDQLRPLTPGDGSVGVRPQGFATFISDPRFTTYRAEFATDMAFTQIAHAIEGAISPLPYILDEGVEYWWRVVGIRNGLDIDTGSTAGFITNFPTSAASGGEYAEAPQITALGRTLEVRGSIGGSRIQIFDVTGRMVLTSVVSDGTGVWLQSLAELPSTPYIVVVTSRSGHVTFTPFMVSYSAW